MMHAPRAAPRSFGPPRRHPGRSDRHCAIESGEMKALTHPSYRKHRRQFALQILLPVTLTSLSACVLMMVVGTAGKQIAPDMGRWAAVAEMLLIIPLLFAGILAGAALTFLTYLLTISLRKLPPVSIKGQDFARRARRAVRRGTDLLVRPVVEVEAMLAAARSFLGRM